MKRLLREYRLIPIVLIATGCLFALKAMGLMFDGGYTLGQRLGRDSIVVTTVPAAAPITLRSPTQPLEIAGQQPSGPKQLSWMQEMFNYPDITGSIAASRSIPKEPIVIGAPKDPGLVTGSVGGNKPAPAASGSEPPSGQIQAPESKPSGAPTTLDASRPASAAERAILERLHQRRQELDARARELEIRESVLKASEKKIEARLAELKDAEARVTAGIQKKDEAEAARLKGVVTMYESMKPREAAKIFDRLDIRVLLDVVTQINPRRMSEILAQMSPEAAERLTVELAAKPNSVERAQNPNELPKIEGRPTGG